MPKPVIWTIDDDPDVLRAVERDLRRQYGDRYKVIAADSGSSALEAVRHLKLRNETVALFIVDQRMPRMSGVEFLEKAIEFYPEAKRALLTAYADTDAAIRAINSVHIDHYLMKPWDPPEERLYGVVDDLLDDWQVAYHPVFEGVRVIGHRWSPQANAIRDFLGRNFVPHQWLNIETPPTNSWPSRARTPRLCRWWFSPMAPPWAIPPSPKSLASSRCEPRRKRPSTTWWWSEPGPRDWQRRFMAQLMGYERC